jgi:outer membrane receptor protein involved in Fe transport
MQTTFFAARPLFVAVYLALAHLGAAHAQTAPGSATEPPKQEAPPDATKPDATKPDAAKPDAAKPEATQVTDALKLDSVVVTGSSSARSKMRSSVSISTIEGDGVVAATASSAAEVLRSVPGLRSESSGGESNANVGVRGIPISAGGARYIQFQEDSLPVLQFGDIAFATPDTWLRADVNLDRLEVVRGGSASTLATGGPGGIINFISKTGVEEGGSIALSKGLDFQQTRVDASFGGRLGPRTRFFVGGFQRSGDGGREGAQGTESGGQIRGNVTQELANGFVRFSFKHLDDRTPTFLPTPVRYAGSEIREIPGLDPRRAAFYNAAWPADNTLTNANGRELSNIRDGLQAKTDAFGFEMDLDVGNGFRVQNNFRRARNSGRFIGIFPGDDVVAAPAGTTIATGVGAGSAYAGDKFTAVVFNTKVDDVSLVANDLKVSKNFDLGGAKLTPVFGLYTAEQTLKLTWNFNQYSLSAREEGAQVLNVPGVVNGSPGFGGCCMNFQDSTYSTTAPYAIVNYEGGPITADASLRRDLNEARGAYYQTLPGFGGAVAGQQYNLLNPRAIDYDFGRTSWSLGGNYSLSRNLALFARVSDGAAYNADRITFFNDANLVNGASPQIPVNEVRQYEGGVKWRAAGFSLFTTLFAAKTDEINVDLTTSPIRVTQIKFDSKGVEFEAAYRSGNFSINGGVTWTDAEITQSSNAALIGKTPKRQADFVYQLTPTFYFGDDAAIGANIVGTTSSKDDGPTGPLTITLPGFTAVNLFGSYAISRNLKISAALNNLFDKIGYTESNDGRGAARSINGRTVKTSLAYTF